MKAALEKNNNVYFDNAPVLPNKCEVNYFLHGKYYYYYFSNACEKGIKTSIVN